MAAMHALEGVKKMCCKITASEGGRINTLLNKAWRQFWNAPDQYLAWEKQELNRTKADLVHFQEIEIRSPIGR